MNITVIFAVIDETRPFHVIILKYKHCYQLSFKFNEQMHLTLDWIVSWMNIKVILGIATTQTFYNINHVNASLLGTNFFQYLFWTVLGFIILPLEVLEHNLRDFAMFM